MAIPYSSAPVICPRKLHAIKGGLFHGNPDFLHSSNMEDRRSLRSIGTWWKSSTRSTTTHCTMIGTRAALTSLDSTMDPAASSGILEQTHAISKTINSQRLVLADLDPATAKLLIGVSGPILSAFGFLFIARIVMSWYPKLPVDKFPYVIAYAPTEPILDATRKLIPPVGGVDVTPVVWFALLSFLNEILLGPQGLLVLLSQQVQ